MQVHPIILEPNNKTKPIENIFWSLQPVYYISKLLAINPYSDNDNFASLNRSDKIYGYFIMCMVIVIMTLSVVARVLYTYNTMVLSMAILDFSTSLSQLILVVISIRFTIVKHGNKMRLFFKKLDKIDKTSFIMPQHYYSRIKKTLRLKCIGITVTTLIFAIIETFFFAMLYNPLLGVISACFVKYWMFYYKFIIFLQISTRIGILKERFENVNQILSSKTSIESKIVFKEMIRSKSIKLYKIFETHNILCDMVNIVNDVHGFQILIIICSIIVAILNLLNTGINLILSAMFTSEYGSSFRLQYAAVGIQGLMCLGFVIMSVLMAAQCSLTVEEANQTKELVQKLLLAEPMGSSTNYLHREELVLFINTSRSPAFSAGGFFTIDYTLLLAIMGAVTSYFIVLLQFANVKGNKIV